MRETAKALKAFEDYFNLGPGRSLAKLAQSYGDPRARSVPTKHLATLEKWSSAFRWQERVREREQVIADAALDNIKKTATVSGYAVYQKRVADLSALAESLYGQISDEEKLWIPDPKWVGGFTDGREVDRQRFNSSLVQAYLDTLEAIAEEMGERQVKPDTVAAQAVSVQLPAHMLAPAFLAPHRDIMAAGHAEYTFDGGRGSTKSSFVSLEFIQLLVNNPTMHGLALRQVANTLRDSVYSQLVWAIMELGLEEKFKILKTPLEIEYLPTGQKIYFRGADEPKKIKSIKPAFGYIGLVWFEELDQFRGQEAIRNIEQSAIRGGDLSFTFKTWNTPRTANNWVNKWRATPDPKRYDQHSTYLDVPAEWLGQAFIDKADFLKSINPDAYDHEYGGIANGSGGMVFANVKLKPITNEEIATFERPLQGLDWGYFPDPLHFAKMHYDPARLTLFIYGEYRANKQSNRAVFDALAPSAKIQDAEARIEAAKHDILSLEHLLIADSAEPKSVNDFKQYGANVRSAEKGPDTINYSMKWLQSLVQIVIDPVRCPHTAEEFLNYELERDKDGEFISAYPDAANHAIDAVRYATNLIWRVRGQ